MWIEGARSELALTSWTGYRDMIRRWIGPHLGGKRLVELTSIDVKIWHSALLDHTSKTEAEAFGRRTDPEAFDD
jgi:hypothetical protein